MSRLLIFLTALLLLGHTHCQNLTAVECNARLKTPRSDVASVYDGEDTIYIFGGLFFDSNWDLIQYSDIIAYNITADTTQVVGQLPRTAFGGRAFHDPDTGNIYYLRADGTFLWRYIPGTGVTESVGEWLGDSASTTLVLTSDMKIKSFGGLGDPYAVYQFDINTGEQGHIGRLPLQSQLSVGIYTPETNLTYIFAGELGTWDPTLMIYDHSTNITTVEGTVFPSWRHGDGSPIWDGTYIYMVGAVVDNGRRGNGIIQFNKDTIEPKFISVLNLADLLTSTSAVYVENLNRIYIIGGYDDKNDDRDLIWYVSLNDIVDL